MAGTVSRKRTAALFAYLVLARGESFVVTTSDSGPSATRPVFAALRPLSAAVVGFLLVDYRAVSETVG